MIRCLPVAICSWKFRLESAAGTARIEHAWMTEQGMIELGGARFDICKHGLASGHWTLEHGGLVAASAQKTSMFTRTFEVQAAGEAYVLRAQSALGRSFNVEQEGRVVATIAPDHPFTRRSRITMVAGELDLITAAFLFWLAVLTWKRAANNDS